MNALAIAVLIVLLAVVLRVVADNGLGGFPGWLQAKFGGVGPATASPPTIADVGATGAAAATSAANAAGAGGAAIGSATQQALGGFH